MEKHDDRRGAAPPPGAPAPAGTLQSSGEDAAKAYAKGQVAPRPLHPTMEMQTVWIEDPQRLPPPGSTAKAGSGPRNPEQRAPLAEDKGPTVTMPAGLPVTKLQPIIIDSELLMQWHAERDRQSANTNVAPQAIPSEQTDAAATGSLGALAVRAPAQTQLVVKVQPEAAAPRATRSATPKAAWMLAAGLLMSSALGALGWRCSHAERAAEMAETPTPETGAVQASAPLAAIARNAEPDAAAQSAGRGHEAEEMGGGGDEARGTVSSVTVPSGRRPPPVHVRPGLPASRGAPQPKREPAQAPPATTTAAATPAPPSPEPAAPPGFFEK